MKGRSIFNFILKRTGGYSIKRFHTFDGVQVFIHTGSEISFNGASGSNSAPTVQTTSSTSSPSSGFWASE